MGGTKIELSKKEKKQQTSNYSVEDKTSLDYAFNLINLKNIYEFKQTNVRMIEKQSEKSKWKKQNT